MKKHRNLILYGLIGGFSASLDFGLYTLLCTLGLNYLVANILSVNTGIITSFILNRQYNFKVKNKTKKRFLSFYTIGLMGLGLSSALLYGLVDICSVNKLVAKLITVFVVALVQYLLNKRITFKK